MFLRFIFIYTLTVLAFQACQQKNTLFEQMDARKTGISFNNQITEYDTFNILNTEFIYNGGGVGIGDFNADGWQDVFFTGNQVDNCLYLNKGNWQFEDVTKAAGLSKKQPQEWASGINIIDLNADGRQDIYICNTLHPKADMRHNRLYINQGNDAAGTPRFEEMAAAYGIADTTHSSNAQFFDYDLDGDLDLFIAVNFMDTPNPNRYIKKTTDGTSVNRDRLYRNDPDPTLGHPMFTDVSAQAGIILEGYSHSTLISDFNRDGWPDIYVANDYVTNDLLYINQKNGTFKNEVARLFKHQAASAMGSDAGDLNNDGQPDYFITEMLPYYNKRKKLFLGPNMYSTYLNNDLYGYEYQYARNVLQLNQGHDPVSGMDVFSDVSFITGTQETEWSWSPLIADFDNDGQRDVFVTNGFPRDVTDHDFSSYYQQYSALVPPMELQDAIPQIKVPKFMFKNAGNLHFEDVSKKWGLDKAAFSNGAAYGDLDNDGDLDLVVNNINDPAFLLRNHLNDQKEKSAWLRLRIQGNALNPDGIGITLTAYFNGQAQAASLLSARGYLSSPERVFHLGLGQATSVDSVVFHLGDRRYATLLKPALCQTLTVRLADLPVYTANALPQTTLFQLVAEAQGLTYMHRDSDHVDFNYQVTLPHKFSQYGPALAVGDMNGDHLDDIYISGSVHQPGTWLIQDSKGNFRRQEARYKTDPEQREEELGALLFDADRDGDNDLYIVHGGNHYDVNNAFYQDVLCVNRGDGTLQISSGAVPPETACGQCVKAADYDGDGDLDLFVGARLRPRTFPQADRSMMLRNDSKGKDQPLFTDVTDQVCPELARAGLITDALWTDFNGDQRPDLLLAGEWMPLTFFQNRGNTFANVTAQTSLADQTGWWTSLTAADFDNDGDTDYVAGNFGKNTYFQCTAEEPLTLYAKDFDKNTYFDPFISCYWRDSLGRKHEYLYHSRDDLLKQLILLRRRFNTYGQMGAATVQDMFSATDLEGAMILKTRQMASCYLENKGNNLFEMTALPVQAQLAPIQGMLATDVDADGYLDLLLIGNDYGMELLQGRADAFNGLLLRNTPAGPARFEAVRLDKSGFYVPFDGRSLVRIVNAQGKERIVAAQNRAPLKVFAPAGNAPVAFLAAQPDEIKAVLTLQNGQQRLQEFYWGDGYLSQSPRLVRKDAAVRAVTFYKTDGTESRRILQ